MIENIYIYIVKNVLYVDNIINVLSLIYNITSVKKFRENMCYALN